jgi:hypothetical protein
MRRGIQNTGALVLVLTGTLACNLPPMISDTGYRGTWGRGSAQDVSIVAITEVAGRWYFRWTKRSFDGKQTVLCDWGGHCEEQFNGRAAATYTITTRYDAGAKTLATDTVEERVYPSSHIYHYSDVMEVADSGLTLWNYTTDREGQHFEGGGRPMRSFSKVSNSVADPPRPARP